MEHAEYRRMFEAEDSHWWYVSLHGLVGDAVRKEHSRKGPLAILDAGCGTGRLLQLLQPFGAVQGCDASEEALRFCRERGLERVWKADLNAVDLGQERFDVITSIDVLYHQGIRDEARVLATLHTALRADGVAVVQVPAFEFLRSTHDAAVHTRRRYLRRDVVRLMQQAGFLIERATYRVGLLFFPIAAYRIAGRVARCRGQRVAPRSDVRLPRGAVNGMLTALMKGEQRLLRTWNLPFGTSVYVVARKQKEAR